MDINNISQAVGYSYSNNYAAPILATFWNGTTATGLESLGGTQSQAHAINNLGQVVGYSHTAYNAAMHATLWNGTTATDLNSLLDADRVSEGWVLTQAHGINGDGWVVGDAYNQITGQTHAFLLSTVPEPATLALLGIALAGLGTIAALQSFVN